MSDSKALILNSSGDLAEVLVDSLVDKPAITTASAATVDLYNVTSNTVFITGTTTITSFGTPPVDGAKRLVQFIGSLTLTHGTGGGQIRLPGLANITTSSGDMAEFISSGGVWICYNYTKLNGQSVVGGGGSDDGVTASNICDLAMDGTTLLDTFRPYYYKKSVGVAQLVWHGAPATAPNQYGSVQSSQGNSGTGAATTQTTGLLGEVTASPGTTAAGYTTFYTGLVPDYTAVTGFFYSEVKNSAGVGLRMAIRLAHYISAVSDATQAYSASITLFGRGPITNGAISATTTGVTLTYTHSVNSGNYVINYRGNDGTLKTINTSVAPGVGLAACTYIIAKAHRTAAGTGTITINIAGTVYTITDAAFNTDTAYFIPQFGARVLKSAGTTARTLNLRHLAIASNFL